MDIATIIGIVSGIGLVIGSILMNSGLDIFIDIPSFAIVIGGTTAAIFISFPLKEVLKVMGLTIRVFVVKSKNPADTIKELVELANKSKKEGLLALEADIKNSKDPFLTKALQMTVDGLPTEVMSTQINQEIGMEKIEHKLGIDIFAKMGEYCPAFGMVGTLIGLIQMLADLSDPSSIGPKMAVAMITTFYGSLFANLFFLPMSNKLTRRSASEQSHKTLLFEGIMAIRNGENPKVMEERLMVYAEAKKGKDKGKEK